MHESRLILVNLFGFLVVFVEQVDDVGEEFSYSCGVDVEFDYCWFESVTHFVVLLWNLQARLKTVRIFRMVELSNLL